LQSQLLHSPRSNAGSEGLGGSLLGGQVCIKIFGGRNVDLIYLNWKLVFKRCTSLNLGAAGPSGIEAFVVCEEFNQLQDTGSGATFRAVRAEYE